MQRLLSWKAKSLLYIRNFCLCRTRDMFFDEELYYQGPLELFHFTFVSPVVERFSYVPLRGLLARVNWLAR